MDEYSNIGGGLGLYAGFGIGIVGTVPGAHSDAPQMVVRAVREPTVSEVHADGGKPTLRMNGYYA